MIKVKDKTDNEQGYCDASELDSGNRYVWVSVGAGSQFPGQYILRSHLERAGQ